LPEPSSAQGPVNQSLAPVGNSSAYGAPAPITPLPPGLAAPPDMKSLAKALKRHWLLATTLGLMAATAASAAAWYLMPVRYTAEAVIVMNKNRLVPVDNEGFSPFTALTLSQLVKQRWIVQKALEEPGVSKLPSVRDQLYPVEWLRRGLQVTYQSEELMTITLSGYNSAELVTLVDAVARVYVQELGAAERTIRLDRVSKITAIIDKLNGFVKREKTEFLAFIQTNGAANAQQRQNQADFDRMRLARLIQQKVDARMRLDALNLEDEQSKKGAGPRVRNSEVMRELEENKEVRDFNAQIEARKKVMDARIGVGMEKNHKRLQDDRDAIKKLEDDLQALRTKLTPEIRKILLEKKKFLGDDSAEDNKNEIAATNALIKMIDQQMEDLEKALKEEGPQTFEIEERKARYAAEDGVVDVLRRRRALLQAEAEQAASSATSKGDVVAFAEQNFKKQVIMASGAGGGALALVLFVISYWEFRVRRINTGEDVVYGLGWRLVGQLPPLPERSRGGLLRKHADPQYWQNLMTESVDATRTMILHAARAEGLRTVMVTSAVSGEGKTSLSCHLACSLARAGRKTLLLDCDMRNPAAHRLFELPSEPGLCEVLRGEAQLADVIRATPATNLWLIPAGQFDEQALQTFTLSQDGFSPLLEQLKAQFDFIVIDSSPVLPVVDTLVVAQNVDVVVFSLLRDVSRIPSVYAAYQRLATLGVRILGAVVNGVDTGSYGYSRQYTKV